MVYKKARPNRGALFYNVRRGQSGLLAFGPAKYQMMKSTTGRTRINRIHSNFALVLVFVLMIWAIAHTSRTKMMTLNSQPM
jgi:hypothetical protein